MGVSCHDGVGRPRVRVRENGPQTWKVGSDALNKQSRIKYKE